MGEKTKSRELSPIRLVYISIFKPDTKRNYDKSVSRKKNTAKKLQIIRALLAFRPSVVLVLIGFPVTVFRSVP